jgi:hypothetical protein
MLLTNLGIRNAKMKNWNEMITLDCIAISDSEFHLDTYEMLNSLKSSELNISFDRKYKNIKNEKAFVWSDSAKRRHGTESGL